MIINNWRDYVIFMIILLGTWAFIARMVKK